MRNADYANALTPEAPIEAAERWASRSRTAGSRLTRLVRGPLDELLGHVIAEALLPSIDDVVESAGEAMIHFREAIDDAREETVRRVDAEKRARADLGLALDLLREAVADADRRYKRRGTDPPEWVTCARSAIRNPSTAGEPF